MTRDEAFGRLARSKFRSRFKLSRADRAYVQEKGLDVIRLHVRDFIRQKLAPADPVNDGKQTPMSGHPAFKAMHATAMCCRDCMEKWWKVPRHVPLSQSQCDKAENMIVAWVERAVASTPTKA